ncbi:hypothetical protein CLU94_0281 [Janthinobacterium sp. 13]|nr:hypothetical protein CLU94_0281 [Janthinobacterium sp. 13]
MESVELAPEWGGPAGEVPEGQWHRALTARFFTTKLMNRPGEVKQGRALSSAGNHAILAIVTFGENYETCNTI